MSESEAWFPGIDSPNFTMQPNVLYDTVMPRVSAAEWKVVSLIVRQTAGWHAETADISVDDIVTGTGLSKSTVFRALGELTRQGVLVSRKNTDERGGTLPSTYGLRYRQGGLNLIPQASQNDTPQGASVTPPFPIEERNPVKETEASDVWERTLATLRTVERISPGNIRMLEDLSIRLDRGTLVVRCSRDLAERWGGYLRKAAEVPVRFEVG